MTFRLIFSVLLTVTHASFAKDIHEDINAALDRVSKLKYMQNDGRKYSLPARNERFTGISDDFLRRRTANEILSSGLASGCGDFATSFYDLMHRRGLKMLYLDAVQLTASSLLNRDNGHTGVAVEDPESGHWILVDPTDQKIVAENWDIHSRIYENQYWIWYLGPIEDYPANDHPSLKKYYDRALKSIPASVWNDKIIGLDFEAGPSMRMANGSFINPNCAQFLNRFGNINAELGLNPKRRVKIVFSDNSVNKTGGDCHYIDSQTFECFVKHNAKMSFSWFTWIEEYVNRNIDKKVFTPLPSDQDSISLQSEAGASETAVNATFAAHNPWSDLAKMDLDAMHQNILENHPGPQDSSNPAFKDWLEKGYRLALKKTAGADSYEGYVFSLAYYAAGFKDGHLAVWQKLTPKDVQWPGFIAAYRDGRLVVRSTAPAEEISDLLPGLGDEIAACDGIDTKALLRQNIFPYFEDEPSLEALWNRYTPRLFVDLGNPFIKRPSTCEFRHEARNYTLPLHWGKIAEDDLSKRVRNATATPPSEPEILSLGERKFWIRLQTFWPSDSQIPLLKRIIERMPSLRHADLVVFDVRGNNGGNTMWGEQILQALYGKTYIDTINPNKNIVTLWRASKGNQYHIDHTLLPMIEKQFGKGAPECAEFGAVSKGIAESLSAGVPFYKEPPEAEVAMSSGPAGSVTAKVALVTDGSCASACLKFVDTLLAIPGVKHLGLPTAADSLYMELRQIPLPSGISTLGLPITLESSRKRGNNQPYIPALRPPVDIGDTPGLQKWVLEQFK